VGYYSVNYSQWLLGYVHWQGRELAKYSWSNEFDFFHPNSLGSAGMTSQPSGNVWDDMLFYPWGEVWLNTGTNTFDTHFASIHASLQGSNLIDWTMCEADHRFYAPNPGRWHTPDPAGKNVVKLDDPQTWNMYAYVRHNPTTLTDPSGLYGVACSSDWKTCQKLAGQLDAALQQTQNSTSDDIKKAGQAYGTLGDMNGVTVTFANSVDQKHSNVVGQVIAEPGTKGAIYVDSSNDFRQATRVILNPHAESATFEERVIDEGVHVENRETIVQSMNGVFDRSLNITGRQSEINAYGVENIFRRSIGLPPLDIKDILSHPPYSDNPTLDKPLFPDWPGPQ
jgi:RHS repeat-associated protein